MTVKARANGTEQSVLKGARLSLGTLLQTFPGFISLTWLLTLVETVLIALIPLFIGFAIDGLLEKDNQDLLSLAGLLGILILVGVARRLFDTRAYGTIRVELGRELVARAGRKAVSKTNARLDMGREIADFLEIQVPQLLSSIVQLGVALVVLWSFHMSLFVSAMVTGMLILLVYAAVHRRFFKLNGDLNQQMEQQVSVLSNGSSKKLWVHLSKLRKAEVRISDTEAWMYGVMFVLLIGFVLFNLWFAAGYIEITAGRIFSIVSYSLEFLEAALILPATLQDWTRLSEITSRINANT